MTSGMKAEEARVSYVTEYTSASVNRYANCMDISRDRIAFGGHNAVYVYSIETDLMIGQLMAHKDRVNCVKWVENCDNLIISSSADKTSIIWHFSGDNKFCLKYRLIGHKESIIVSHSYKLDDNRVLSISCSTDNCVKVWLNDDHINELIVDNFVFDFKICKNDNIFKDIVIISVGANETINFHQLKQSDHQLKPLIEVKGHEDWIRSVDIIATQNDNLLIATSSQDFYIRVHRIKRVDGKQTETNQIFSIETEDSKSDYCVILETVLCGHEGWVNQIRWTSVDGSLRLLSASIDKSMILWQPTTDSFDGVWTESVRVGEVGGNTLGFLGCAASQQLDLIAGYSFNGALHCWKRLNNQWTPLVAISGHFDEVTDIVWEPEGEYLLSCATDQTTRLHSICKNNFALRRWHELARPQIHGYDIKCIAMVGRNSFVSGADEKVIRVFKATKCFANSLQQISNIDISKEIDSQDTAHSASVPTLGLSNCAVYEPERLENEFRPQVLESLPTEETLLQNTLWPEVHKLYGHVFEIFSVATSNDRQLMASASKASKAEHADIILWYLTDTKLIQKLSSHQLTVTRIRFSSDDRYIVSASRDRTWALFERQMGNNFYKRIGFSGKSNGVHSRIIWDIAFTEDNHYFCSVSRDKTAVFWNINAIASDDSSSLGPVRAVDSPLTLSQSITAVDICRHLFGDNYLVAFGLEDGNICFYYWNKTRSWSHLLDIKERHSSTINRISFSSKMIERSDGVFETLIASCGVDHCLHIFRLSLNV